MTQTLRNSGSDLFIRYGIWIVLIWGFVWLLHYLSDVLIPFFVAVLIAYLLNPLVSWIQKFVKNRAAAVFITLASIAMISILLLWLIIPIIIEQSSHMAKLLSQLVTNSPLAERASQRIPANIWQIVKDFIASPKFRELFQTDNFWNLAGDVGKKLVPGVWGLITGTANFIMGLVGLFIIGLYLVFLMIDYNEVKAEYQQLIPESIREPLFHIAHEFNDGMRNYFRAQAFVAFLVGVLFAIGFTLIGLPLGILLGLLIGLLNMVPYLQIIGLVPATILATIHALETGTDFWLVIVMTLMVFVVVQIIQDAFLVPKIMNKATGLSPAIILLSLSIWGKLLGVLGLLIAIPVSCLILAYFKRFLSLVETVTTEKAIGGTGGNE